MHGWSFGLSMDINEYVIVSDQGAAMDQKG